MQLFFIVYQLKFLVFASGLLLLVSDRSELILYDIRRTGIAAGKASVLLEGSEILFEGR